MAVKNQHITETCALYNGDACEVLADLPSASMGLSVYSPPFGGLYHYSSDERDLSNCRDYEHFFEHYAFVVREIARLTMPGRITAVHCMDIPNPGQRTGYFDLPGRIVALHQEHGFDFFGRVLIWKEPLTVAMRTKLQHLQHKHIYADASRCTIAAGDQLLILRRRGENKVPVTHERGFLRYAGARQVPAEYLPFRGERDQTINRFSQWIWRNYASCIWDDIRIDRVLPYKAAKEPDDEKHVHPLQLDVIERAVQLWSNEGETLLTPFMGVGSEAYGAAYCGRRAVGIELKASYYRQAIRNVAQAPDDARRDAAAEAGDMLGAVEPAGLIAAE